MTAKAWNAGEIRDLARKTINCKRQLLMARGAYFCALLETAQAELGGTSNQQSQRAAVKGAHKRFYPIVWETIATDEIILADGFPRKEVANERNRRLNFARSSYGTIQRWLRAPGHDLTKLDSRKATKCLLEKEAPPRPHALTPQRIQKRAGKLIAGLLGFTRQIAKTDRAEAEGIVKEAMNQLVQVLGVHIAAQKHRSGRVGRTLLVPSEISQHQRRAA